MCLFFLCLFSAKRCQLYEMVHRFGFILLAILIYLGSVLSQGLWDCHDDPPYEPLEGPLYDLHFNWLGGLQYIHVKNATPHYFRVPRVVLISRQFTLVTAQDAAKIPENYALGNVVFGDYERDEIECKVSWSELRHGETCLPAVLVMPIADVLLHPEYVHFSVPSSVALLKLLKPIVSVYVVPVCLPFKNLIEGGKMKDKDLIIYNVDFWSDVPRDFVSEAKEVKTVNLIPKEVCDHYLEIKNKSGLAKLICTTGCDFHPGSPNVIHEHTGHWTLLSLSEGGTACPDPLVSRSLSAPPRHIPIFNYVPWITSAISGKPIGIVARTDPFGDSRFESVYDAFGHAWNGHWWMGGIRCRDRGEAAEDIFRFYHEIFKIKVNLEYPETHMTYYLEIDSMHHTTIICVKVGMPYRLANPKVWGLDTPTVKVQIPYLHLGASYDFQVEAYAYNETDSASDLSD